MLDQKSERDRVIEENLGLVHNCAARFRGRGIEYDDLFQAGCVGLCKAVDGFDPARGFAFSTYAVPMILGEIKRIFRDGGTVKVGRTVKERARNLLRLQNDAVHLLGREPTVSELAEMAGMDAAQTAFLLGTTLPAISLSASDEDSRPFEIPVQPPDQEIENSLSLKAAIRKLNAEEQKLIQLRFFQGMTQTNAAKLLGISQVQVSRREKVILQKLRTYFFEYAAE